MKSQAVQVAAESDQNTLKITEIPKAAQTSGFGENEEKLKSVKDDYLQSQLALVNDLRWMFSSMNQLLLNVFFE